MRSAARTARCPACSRMLPGVYPSPVDFVSELRQRATISSGSGFVLIVKRPFYEALRPYAPGMIPGEVRLEDGRVLRESVTVHFPPEMEVVMRGGRDTPSQAYCMCRLCRRPVASRSLFKMPWYVLRSQLPMGDIFSTPEEQLLITERVREELNIAPFPDIFYRPVLVLDEPIIPIPGLGDPMPPSLEVP